MSCSQRSNRQRSNRQAGEAKGRYAVSAMLGRQRTQPETCLITHLGNAPHREALLSSPPDVHTIACSSARLGNLDLVLSRSPACSSSSATSASGSVPTPAAASSIRGRRRKRLTGFESEAIGGGGGVREGWLEVFSQGMEKSKLVGTEVQISAGSRRAEEKYLQSQGTGRAMSSMRSLRRGGRS